MTIPNSPLARTAVRGAELTPNQIAEVVAAACPQADYRGQRVLLIIPDHTRTAPVGALFRALHRQIGAVTRGFDILIALGTHPPMSEEAICRRLEITGEERAGAFRGVGFFNHEWDRPDALRVVGTLTAAEVGRLSGGLFELDVPVSVNGRVFDYDQIIIVGPVFPHEVVGFSGGNKYLFPGVAGADILNFFHWLGAVVSSPKIIGHAWTPVRRVVDRAGGMVTVPKLCFCMVVDGTDLAGLYAGSPEGAWEAASRLSAERHILRQERPFHTILSCAPRMYDELWTGGKCMYKLEPVLADDGELIIYAPHITEVSVTHGRTIDAIGYHCCPYFLEQWEAFCHYPWGVLAHSAHVKGVGTYTGGVERPRARVTLATGISAERCRALNLGYRDPAKIRFDDFAGREDQGVLAVPKAGETLYRLTCPPAWAGGEN